MTHPWPTDPDTRAVEDLARAFVEDAAHYARAEFEAARGAAPPGLEYKDEASGDPVTVVDRTVEARLVETVAARFPGHAVLGEEGADPEGDPDWVWVVDPIDGTRNFVSGLPLFAVSVGVLHRGRPVVGAVALPPSGDVFHARRGGGAVRNGRPTRVAPADVLTPALHGARGPDFWTDFDAAPGLRPLLGEARWFGSTACELAWIAAGGIAYGAFGDVAVWDAAGGVVVAREAGADVRVWGGGSWRPLDEFASPDGRPLRTWNRPVLAGPPAVVEALAARLSVPQTHEPPLGGA